MKKTALITGASGGIGKELAVLFAADGYNLVLVARSEKTMQEFATTLEEKYGTKSLVLAKDLSLQTAPQEVFEEVQRQGVVVDVLVNNAGFGSFGPFADTDIHKEMEMLHLNILALSALCKLFLPGMVARGQGRILNVASTAAFQPGPLMAGYYASKAFVLSLTEALANELQGTGVTITALCPGATETGFQSKAEMQKSKLFKSRVMDVQTVARAGYRALMAGKTIEIPGLMNKLLATSVRWMPRALVPGIVRKIQEEA